MTDNSNAPELTPHHARMMAIAAKEYGHSIAICSTLERAARTIESLQAQISTPAQAAKMIEPINELLRLVEGETGINGLCHDEPDSEPVATFGDGSPSPMTFGHVRRARAALRAIAEQDKA